VFANLVTVGWEFQLRFGDEGHTPSQFVWNRIAAGCTSSWKGDGPALTNTHPGRDAQINIPFEPHPLPLGALKKLGLPAWLSIKWVRAVESGTLEEDFYVPAKADYLLHYSLWFDLSSASWPEQSFKSAASFCDITHTDWEKRYCRSSTHKKHCVRLIHFRDFLFGDAKSLSSVPTPTRRLFAFKVLRQHHCLESFSWRMERKGTYVHTTCVSGIGREKVLCRCRCHANADKKRYLSPRAN
jgi:hypothetical protein